MMNFSEVFAKILLELPMSEFNKACVEAGFDPDFVRKNLEFVAGE